MTRKRGIRFREFESDHNNIPVVVLLYIVSCHDYIDALIVEYPTLDNGYRSF